MYAPRGAYRTSDTLVIRRVSLIDGTGAGLRPDATVVVSGSRIEAVGSDPGGALPDGACVVDGSGKFLIPGLWDCHVHAFCHRDWVETMLPVFVAHGIVGIRDMHGEIALAAPARAEVSAGTRVGPRILTAGFLIDGDPPVLPGTPVATTPEEGRQAVRLRRDQGADFVKVYSRLGRDVFVAILDEAARLRMPVAGHVPQSVSASEASTLGQRTFEHLMGLEADAGLSRSSAGSLFETLARNGTWQVPTLVAWRALAGHPLGRARDVLEGDLRSACLAPSIRRMWTSIPEEKLAPAAAAARDLMPLRERIVGDFCRAGVPILAGSDTPNPFVFPGSGLHEELALLVGAGLTEMQALVAATAGPARCFGLAATHGTIEPGKAADLVLLDGNPLEDIRHTGTIAGVVLGGESLDRAALAALLGRAEAAAAQPAPGGATVRAEFIITGRRGPSPGSGP